MKSLTVIFVILIIGIAFISIWDFYNTRVIDDSNYNEIAWRLPVEKEIDKISNSFIHSSITLCAVYFIKKFAGEKYLIACEGAVGTWTYYTVYSGQNKIYKTSDDLAANFLPPIKIQDDRNGKTEKHFPRLKKNDKIVPVKSTVEAK